VSSLHDRYLLKVRLESDEKARAACIALCRKDVLFFFDYFLWTFDPRKNPKDIPFIPWKFQRDLIVAMDESIARGESELYEKSRDMGVTWCVLGVFVYRWLMHDENFLSGSRKESLVDTLGNISTHFERMRYMIAKIPDWMCTACGVDRKKTKDYMKIFKANGASIVGESMNAEFSRQGRYKAILLDEFAFADNAETIWRACGDSAPCKLVVSTPNGTNNKFCHLRKSGQIKVNTIHWRMHPEKDEAWYAKQKAEKSEKDLAQEADINYTISAGTPFYTGFQRAVHLRKMNLSPNREITLTWDYGFQHPNCTLNYVTAEGIWVIADNIFGENCTIEEFAVQVREYLNKNWSGYRFAPGYGDPAGKQSSDKSRKSSEQILNECGFVVSSIPSNLPTTNYAARKVIIEKKLRTLIGGVPALVVNDVPGCAIIAEGFEGGYRFPDSNKYGGVAEHPVEDGYFEHPFNSLEYFAVNRFKPVEKDPKQETERRARYGRAEPMRIGF